MNRKIQLFGIVSGLALATLGTAGAAQAALMVVPTGLNPGDQYRLVFVTSGTIGGWYSPIYGSANINDYNNFVTNDATGGTAGIDTALDVALNSAGFNPNTITWKAIGSTQSVAARDNTDTNPTEFAGVPIYLIDGKKIANNYLDLWDGSIKVPINRTPVDSLFSGLGVWTGSSADGNGAWFNVLGFGPGWWEGCYVGWECLPLTLGSPFGSMVGGMRSDYGDDDWIAQRWVDWSGPNCLAYGPPYCDFGVYGMSPVLTVPTPTPAVSVPESTPSLLGYITLSGLILGGAVRKARK